MGDFIGFACIHVCSVNNYILGHRICNINKDKSAITLASDKNNFFSIAVNFLTRLDSIIKTITKDDTLSNISKEYNVSISDILTYNNKLDENITIGETIKIPIKTIDPSNVNKVKKLITENKIKYIYSNNDTTNDIVNELIKDNKLELVTINTMYSIDGNITNTNDNYLTIMKDNLELLKKELYK